MIHYCVHKVKCNESFAWNLFKRLVILCSKCSVTHHTATSPMDHCTPPYSSRHPPAINWISNKKNHSARANVICVLLCFFTYCLYRLGTFWNWNRKFFLAFILFQFKSHNFPACSLCQGEDCGAQNMKQFSLLLFIFVASSIPRFESTDITVSFLKKLSMGFQ